MVPDFALTLDVSLGVRAFSSAVGVSMGSNSAPTPLCARLLLLLKCPKNPRFLLGVGFGSSLSPTSTNPSSSAAMGTIGLRGEGWKVRLSNEGRGRSPIDGRPMAPMTGERPEMSCNDSVSL